MPPSRDQRALLDLILRRGHGYADVAALIEVSPDEVRARAHDALEELAGTDPDARAEVTDLLLGQLEPAANDEVLAALERDPEALDLASELSAKLSVLVPGAQLPDLPRAGGGSAVVERLRTDARARTVAAALAVATVAIVLAVVLGGGGDDEAPEPTPTSTTTNTDAQAPPPTLIALVPEPAAPEGASGRIGIGQVEGTFALQYFAEGLEPTEGSERYVVWLNNGPDAAVPVTTGRRVGQNGRLNGLASLAPDVVRALPQTAFVDISLEPAPEERGSFAYDGQRILRGRLAAAARGGEGLPEE